MSSQNQLIALLLLSIVAIQGHVLKRSVELLSSKDVDELINATAVACGAEDDTFEIESMESLFDLKLNETKLQEVKCFLGCIMKKFGWISDNNEFDRERFLTWTESIPDSWYDEDESCDTDEFEEKCATLKADNECELGWSFYQCIESICESNEEETANEIKKEFSK